MEISVIIPSYQSQETIEASISAVLSQVTSVDYEVIVVDSSLSDQVDSIVKKFPKVVLLKQQERILPAMARNIGAKVAKGKLLFFIDSDVIIDPGVLEKVWDAYLSKDYKVFAGSLILTSLYQAKLGSLFENYFFLSESLPANPNRIRRNLPSAMLIIEKKIFEQCGPFENLPRNQDTKLTEKIRKNGYILNYIPEIKATYFHNVRTIDIVRRCLINGVNICYIRFGDVLSPSKRLVVFFYMLMALPVKCALMFYRNLAYRPEFSEKLKFVVLSPIVLIGNIFWFIGGMKVVLFNPGIDPRR